ncbi:MAG: adenylate/guanylate cyclase protein [Rhizobium sp.]|nr:adenylate/guanylate cyclase protein [Rhizobium sp.]
MRSIAPEQARICLGCWDQMHMPIPLRGLLALPFRAFGITRSKMNPNICTICERSFTYVKKQRHITADATILFADIRGFTHLSGQLDPNALTRVVSQFHDQCAQAIWSEGGIVNKQMGDGLMAIFNFPIKNDRHAEAAIRAAIDIQRRCKRAHRGLSVPGGPQLDTLPGVGVGIHAGEVEIGEFSTFRSDFTAIGGTVNLTSRLEAQAAAGEILVSSAAAEAAPEQMAAATIRQLTLKGIDQPVLAHVLKDVPAA